VIIGSVDEDGGDWQSYVQALLERRVDGIILNVPVLERDVEFARALVAAAVPVVALHEMTDPSISVVSADDYQIARIAVDHLVSLGHRKIAMVTGRASRQVVEVRAAAYTDALTAAGIPYDPRLVVEGAWAIEGGYQATHTLLSRGTDFTAVYSHNDPMAIGVLAALYDRGVSVPAECSVIGCDDLASSARTIPPLTTVKIPFFEIGEEATRVLVERQQGAAPARRVAGSLVFRASTAPVPSTSR
jgi:LacI family transcriptional regulator